MIGRSVVAIRRAEALLEGRFGPVILRSEQIAFEFTDYYRPEMGEGLIRQWVASSLLPEPDQLADIKQTTIGLERELVDDQGRRQVNLDPGFLSHHNLILATTKPFAHRVCLRAGIYAELTLVHRNGTYQPLDWTYPDYRTGACHDFLAACRAGLPGPALQP
ncbi:DUF4416 family protein [candidate division WOR-3 bacterium]|nr:DUF4416 family protein [candidate division WOR-3 bacterium]